MKYLLAVLLLVSLVPSLLAQPTQQQNETRGSATNELYLAATAGTQSANAYWGMQGWEALAWGQKTTANTEGVNNQGYYDTAQSYYSSAASIRIAGTSNDSIGYDNYSSGYDLWEDAEALWASQDYAGACTLYVQVNPKATLAVSKYNTAKGYYDSAKYLYTNANTYWYYSWQ